MSRFFYIKIQQFLVCTEVQGEWKHFEKTIKITNKKSEIFNEKITNLSGKSVQNGQQQPILCG